MDLATLPAPSAGAGRPVGCAAAAAIDLSWKPVIWGGGGPAACAGAALGRAGFDPGNPSATAACEELAGGVSASQIIPNMSDPLWRLACPAGDCVRMDWLCNDQFEVVSLACGSAGMGRPVRWRDVWLVRD